MPALNSCPAIETLSDFLLGKLDENTRESVAEHVEGCNTCFSRLDEVNQTPDSLVHKLRQPVVDDAFIHEPECQMAVQRSQRLNPELAVRTDILRDYELAETLGEGGMGTVYRALHKKLDKWVAIKLLPTERLHCTQSVSRFEREMRAIGRLGHPNIVQAYDAGEADGQHYLVMELIEGIDLSSLMRRLGQLSIADACEIIRQVALGLQHAHESDLVHRDIKPSNVMITSGGEVKILDLGLALLEEPLAPDHEVTSSGQIMGTLDYMAPEQLGDSHAVDHRADIYSLGATLYTLLTGRAPYADHRYRTPQKKLMAIATKPINPAVGLRADIPPHLTNLLDSMLAKNPDERFASTDKIATALAEFTAGADLRSLFAQADQELKSDRDTNRLFKSTFDPIASSFTDTNRIRPTAGAVPPTSTASRRLWQRPAWIVAVGLSCMFVTVFYVRTGDGTLVVKVDDEQVAVALQKHGMIVHDKRTGREYNVLHAGDTKLPKGDFRLSVSDDAGLTVDTKEFTLSRNGHSVVSIMRSASPPPVNDYALQFNGFSSHIVVPKLTYGGKHPFTIECFASVTTFNRHATLISNGMLWLKLMEDQRWEALGHKNGTPPGDSVRAQVGSSQILADQLYHVAMTYDGSEMALYVDGRRCDGWAKYFEFAPTDRPFVIGASYEENSATQHRFFFHGVIDEIRVSKESTVHWRLYAANAAEDRSAHNGSLPLERGCGERCPRHVGQ